MRKQTISLAMIVKNEEAMLPECLKSVKGIVDEIIIVDTGSTDGTVQVAQNYGAKILYHPWNNDFAEARNVALGQCHCSWVLQLDADERLMQWNKQLLSRYLNNEQYSGFIVTVESMLGAKGGKVCSPSLRVFRRDQNVHYEGIVHESVMNSIQREGGTIGILPFSIIHYGYEDESRLIQKAERNVTLMSTYLVHHPDDNAMKLHYGMGLVTLKRYEEAQKVLATLVSNNHEPTLTATVYNLLAQIANEVKNYKTAIEYAEKSLQLIPEQLYARKIAAVALMYLFEYAEAERMLLSIKDLLLRKNSFPQTISWYDSFPALPEVIELLGACVAEQGKYEEAMMYFLDALTTGAQSQSLVQNIQRLLPLVPRIERYEKYLREKIRKEKIISEAILVVWIEFLCALGDYTTAQAVGKQYSLPENVVFKAQVRWMVQHGEEEQIQQLMGNF